MPARFIFAFARVDSACPENQFPTPLNVAPRPEPVLRIAEPAFRTPDVRALALEDTDTIVE